MPQYFKAYTPPRLKDFLTAASVTGVVGTVGAVFTAGVALSCGGPVAAAAAGGAILFGLLGGVGLTGLNIGTSGQGNLAAQQGTGIVATIGLALAAWNMGASLERGNEKAAPAAKVQEEFNYVCNKKPAVRQEGDAYVVTMPPDACAKKPRR